MIHRKTIKALLCLLMLAMTTGAKAQTADMRIGELLNSGDWFALEVEYPALRDSVQTPMLRLMSEALLGHYFNRPDETVACTDSLLRNHQAELGLGNITSMLFVKAAAEAKRGNHGAAADMLSDFAAQLRAQGIEMDYTTIDQVAQHYGKFRTCPPMSVVRPAGDAVIAMTNDSIVLKIENDTVQRGTMMRVPVTVGGNEYRAIFDTGAGSTFMSAAFAQKAGVRVIADSLRIQGSSMVYGRVGMADSMRIGGITVRNVLVTINPDTTLNRVEDIDFLIGADIMALLGEVQIFPHSSRIVVPAQPTPKPAGGSNMYMDNMAMIVKGESGGKTYGFFLDTGNGNAALSYSFYKSNKAEIDMKARRVKRLTGGIGAVEERDVLVLPVWNLSLGGKEVELRDVAVALEDNRLVPHAGNIGMAVINQFDKVTINLDDCFVVFE